MYRYLPRSMASVLALSVVLSVACAPARAGSVSAFFVGGPRRGFGFVTGYGNRGRYGSLLFLRGPRRTYVSGSVVGRHGHFLGGTFYRDHHMGLGFGGYYRPGFSASDLWVLPPRRR